MAERLDAEKQRLDAKEQRLDAKEQQLDAEKQRLDAEKLEIMGLAADLPACAPKLAILIEAQKALTADKQALAADKQALAADKQALAADKQALQHARAAAAAAVVQQEQQRRTDEPKRKRISIKCTPSDASTPFNVRAWLPGASSDKVAFYSGRPLAASMTLAPPVMTLAPEFGIIHDAAYLEQGEPPTWAVEAAISLCDMSADLYVSEAQRQAAFIRWHNEVYPGIPLSLSRHHHASDNLSRSSTDGHFAIDTGSGAKYPAVIVEHKNECNSGDPYFQKQRYYQEFFRDGESWDEGDIVLLATGAPALLPDMMGPSFLISGVYTLHTNVVVCEPLTPRMLLLPLAERQPRHVRQVARVLAAYAVSAWQLRLRYSAAAGDDIRGRSTTSGFSQPQTMAQEALQSIGSPDVDYGAALASVVLSPADLAAAAARRGTSGLLLPYPLLSSPDYTNVVELAGIGVAELRKRVFAAQSAQGDCVIKFTARPYPTLIHRAWEEQELVPKLFKCRSLPGGFSMVVIERLGSDWRMLHTLEKDLRATAKEMARAALAKAHGIIVRSSGSTLAENVSGGSTGTQQQQQQAGGSSGVSTLQQQQAGSSSGAAAEQQHQEGGSSSSSGNTAHGDVRAPNVMAQLVGGRVMAVKFIDMDWAGIVNVHRYPLLQLRRTIKWHASVSAGGLLQQEHDRHLLEHEC